VREAPARGAPVRDQKEAEARYAEGQRALARGEPNTAEQNLRDAVALNPHLHTARDALVALLIDQNRLDEAQGVLDDGLALEPQRNAFRRLAARLDLARGQPQLAVERLEIAPPSVPADPEYHGLLASAYQRLNRHEEASRLYRSLTQLQPGEAHWWAGYGLSRDALGDVPGALAAYAQARQLGHIDPVVLEHINKRTAALQSAG
jgi:MSHA biogenesis protein MshN